MMELVSKYLLCWPAFIPQITGEVIPEVPEAIKLSVQVPPVASVVTAGPLITNVSKSKRTEQTSLEHLFIV